RANPAGDPGATLAPKALIADGDGDRADIVAGVLRQAGFDTVITRTGRDALKRLNQASDVDVLWINDQIAYPQLPNLLAQIRADVKYGRLPIFVTLSEDLAKAILPELDVRVEHLIRAVPEVKQVDKSPIRITLEYDAQKVTPGQ